MRRLRLQSFEPLGWPEPAVTVGNFDGVHLGHQALARTIVEEVGRSGGTAVALSFEPHPSVVLAPDRAPATLTTVDQKGELLGDLGVERLALIPFTREFSDLPPEEFARKVLRDCLRARLVAVGTGFRFGRGRGGDLDLLRRLGADWGVEVRGVLPVLHEGTAISSSRIREALARGALVAVNAMLGRRFFVDGVVVAGDGRGRGLGFPTANLEAYNETFPGSGVYAGFCRELHGASSPWPAVVNIGHRPTFGGGRRTAEAHLLDYSGDLYGRSMRWEFEARLRDERRFSGAGELAAQIRLDIATARRALLAR
jgi:riboflavin kinase/FMN adenylyltransferase